MFSLIAIAAFVPALLADSSTSASTTSGSTSASTTAGSSTTSANANCTDKITTCEQYRSTYCDNTLYQNLAATYCAKTCGYCSGATTKAPACEDTFHSCSSWNANGYCASNFYSNTQKAQYCAKTCNLCTSTQAVSTTTAASTTTTVATTSPCVDVNTACATLETNGYCSSSTYTDAQKKASCAKTCNLC